MADIDIINILVIDVFLCTCVALNKSTTQSLYGQLCFTFIELIKELFKLSL